MVIRPLRTRRLQWVLRCSVFSSFVGGLATAYLLLGSGAYKAFILGLAVGCIFFGLSYYVAARIFCPEVDSYILGSSVRDEPGMVIHSTQYIHPPGKDAEFLVESYAMARSLTFYVLGLLLIVAGIAAVIALVIMLAGLVRG